MEIESVYLPIFDSVNKKKPFCNESAHEFIYQKFINEYIRNIILSYYKENKGKFSPFVRTLKNSGIKHFPGTNI